MKRLLNIVLILFAATGAGCRNSTRLADEAETTRSVVPDNTEVEKQYDVPDASSDTSKSINEIIASRGNLSTLTSAIETAQLTTMLSGTGVFTMFAPSDSAFNASPVKVRDLERSGPDQSLQKTLAYHLVAGTYTLADIKEGMELTTVHGKKIRFSAKDGRITVNGAEIITPNIHTRNGIVHVIDRVLVP
ncbi:MAG TPA: fasciclin domain-containing protein [Sphingobacteriaceae bacterium]